MPIEYGDLVLCSIDVPGDTDVFRFDGSDGETVIVLGTWQSGSMRPCIELIAPDNTRIKACNNAFSNRIDTTLNQTGTHTILFTDVFGTGTGEYALGLESVIPPSNSAQMIQYGETIGDEINPTGDMDLFFFEGTTGDTIAVVGTWQSGSMRPCIELIAPDNTRIKACNNAFSNRIDTTLNQTGTHTILFTDVFGTGTGEYALGLQCLAGPCVIFPVPDVSGCVKLKRSPLINRRVILKQRGEEKKTTKTDTKGCYEFEEGTLLPGKKFKVIIKGPRVSQ